MSGKLNFLLLNLLFVGFLGGFGDFSTGTIAFLDGFDNTDGNGLSHISDSESSQWSVGREWFDAHWFGWDHFDNSGVTRLDLGWVVFDFLTGSSIDFFDHFVESTSDMGGVAIQDLGVEGFGFSGWVVFAVRAHITSSNIFDGDVF